MEAEPTPPKVAPKGRGSPGAKGHLKGSIGKQSVGRVKAETSGGRHAEQSPAWKKVVGLSEKAKAKGGQAAEGADPGPKHADPRGTDGDGPRGEALEAGRGSEVVCTAPGTPRQPQPVRSPVPASGPEHSGRTSRSHHPRGGGDYRQDQLYKSDADSSSAPAPSSAANGIHRGAWRDSGAGVTRQLLHGDRTRSAEDTRTRGTEDAGCRDGSPGNARSIHAAENDFERQQEGKDLGGAAGEGTGFARSGANGYDVGFTTGVSSSDQVGRANNGQGGGSSEGQGAGRPPASSRGVLGRSLREGGAPRPCAAASFISPLPPAASTVGSASCLPVATAIARQCSHSAAVVKRVAAGVEELGSEGPVEEGSEGPVAQGSGVSPWMLAGDAAYLSKSELSTLQNEHVLRSHIPYLATCEECQRARGLSPQRRLHESQRPRNEIQADKFWFRGVAMLVLVAVGVGMLGTILWQPDRESMVSSFVRWSRSAGLAGSGEVTVSMRSDGEPALVSFLERCCRELPSASLEQVPVDRHAPNAERAIRTLKELAQVQVCSLEKVGLAVAQGGVPYLFSHLSVAHNRYHIEEGSALTPEQRCQQKRIPAHPAYIFGASVLCMPPPSVAHLVNGRLCKGAYLGPEVASASHWVRVQLNSGEFRIVRSPKIRMLMPLRYEVGLLRGICRLLPGRDRPPDVPPLEVDAMKALPLPNTNTRGPPKEWIAEHGKTPRCRACKIKGFDSDKALHTPACRARYAKFLRESFSPEATIAQDRELDQELGFDPAVPDLGDLGFEGLGDYVELPRDVLPEGSGTYDNDPLYEPDMTDEESQLPDHPEGEIANEEAADLMDVEPEPLNRIPEGVATAFAERFEHWSGCRSGPRGGQGRGDHRRARWGSCESSEALCLKGRRHRSES